MANKVALKVVQYRVADSLDKLRLPSNPRAIINREKNAGKTLEDVLISRAPRRLPVSLVKWTMDLSMSAIPSPTST